MLFWTCLGTESGVDLTDHKICWSQKTQVYYFLHPRTLPRRHLPSATCIWESIRHGYRGQQNPHGDCGYICLGHDLSISRMLVVQQLVASFNRICLRSSSNALFILWRWTSRKQSFERLGGCRQISYWVFSRCDIGYPSYPLSRWENSIRSSLDGNFRCYFDGWCALGIWFLQRK